MKFWNTGFEVLAMIFDQFIKYLSISPSHYLLTGEESVNHLELLKYYRTYLIALLFVAFGRVLIIMLIGSLIPIQHISGWYFFAFSFYIALEAIIFFWKQENAARVLRSARDYIDQGSPT